MHTLRERLKWYNMTTEEACKLFDRKERTLWNWNDDPPPWVINVLNLHRFSNPIPLSWEGWRFYNDCLISPEDQYYSQADIRSTLYGKHLAEAIAGSKDEICFLKKHLEKKIAISQSSMVVELKKNNETIRTIDIDLNEYA